MQKVCIMVVIFLSFSSLLQTLDLIKDTWLKPEDGFPTSICLIQGLFFLFLEKTQARPTIPLLWLFNFHQSVSKDLTKCIINNRNHSKMYLIGMYVEYRLLVYTNTMIANCIKLALAEFSVCNSTCVSCLKKFNI